jgi:adenylate cyclase
VSTRRTTSKVLADNIAAWLAEEALGTSEPERLFASLCQRLRASGIPILRGNATYTVLHPLYSAAGLRWTAAGVDVDRFAWNGLPNEQFLRSPFNHIMQHELPLLRRRLSGPTALLDFPVLTELRDTGGHDYLLFSVRFDDAGRIAGDLRRGILCSWVCDRPSGFTDDEIAVLQRLTNRLAVALKARLERSIADNVAIAYLGERAGRAVLSGSIHRGDGDKITAALWYSDLRHSSTLADHDTAEGFLHILNRYFEMTAGAIRDHGGEVVSFIGDAVLGFFRDDISASEACARALEAAEDALRRLAAEPVAPGAKPLMFGIGLHVGQVIYGNVGIPERLQFTLVGSAVNEVARVEDFTKVLECPLIATGAFAREVGRSWRSLGEHALRGIEKPSELFTVLPK